MLARFLPLKNRKRLSRDLLDTFITHSAYVRDVTDTDFCAQNGGTHSRVFRDFQKSIVKILHQKSSEKLLCVFFIPAGPAVLLRFKSLLARPAYDQLSLSAMTHVNPFTS